MSQHDYNIANGGGAAVRSDINNALGAVLSQNSGPTAPTVTQPFMPWYDTTAGVLKFRNAANTAWISALEAVGGYQGVQFRNRIINGDMRIDQRNAGASVSSGFSVDRFGLAFSVGSKFTTQQNAGSATPPSGFTNYLGVTSSSSYSISASDYFNLYQNIEGFNSADLGWGAAGAQAVTLSFWVRSSLTGTFGGALRNGSANYSYPFTFAVSAANTWEQKTIVISGPTAGTWNTTNGSGIGLNFGLGVGSTYSGTAGAWAASNFLSATGATSVVGTTGATFYITGVQLEAGTVASPFERRDYGRELIMCQRYCQVLTDNSRLAGGAFNASVNYMWWQFAVQMRAAPSTVVLSGVGSSTVLCGGSNLPLTGLSSVGGSPSGAFLDANTGGGGTTGFGTQLRLVGSTITATSEL